MKKVTIVSFGLLVAIFASVLAAPVAKANFLQDLADLHEEHQCAVFSVNCDESGSSSSNTTTNTVYNYTYTYGNPVTTPTYTYNSGNRAPVWSSVSDRTAFTGQNLVLYVNATDADNDYLYYDAMNEPNGAYFDRTMHTLYWTPSQDQVGNYAIQFSVTDNFNATVYKTVNIVVVSSQANNRAPVWNSIGDKFVSAGQLLQFTVSATDADGDFVTYSVLNIPSGASFNSSNGTFSWVPNQNQNGTYFVSFRASDGKTTTDMGVRIQVGNGTVTPVFNNAPQFFGFNPPTSATINQLYTYDVNASDADGDALTYSLISAPASMSINSGTGFLAWVPTSTGANTIRVAVSDGRNQTTADFTVTVFGASTPLPAPVTPVAPTEARLVISDITIENVNDEIVVGWKTNIPSGSRVVFDTTSQADKTRDFTYANATVDDRELVTTHSVNIGKLDTNKVYYLRVVSKTSLQTAIGQEIGFIKLGNGVIQNLFGASLIDIFGSLFTSTGFLWILVLGLGTAAGLMYRKQRKAMLVL